MPHNNSKSKQIEFIQPNKHERSEASIINATKGELSQIEEQQVKLNIIIFNPRRRIGPDTEHFAQETDAEQNPNKLCYR